jgi:ATP-independent RNA helicase DbpA
MRTLQIVGGRKEKIRAGDVMGALAGECGLGREQVGKIQVNEFSTYVAVLSELAPGVEARLLHGKIKGKSVKVRVI